MRKLCWFSVPGSAAILAAVSFLPEGLLLPAGFLCALLALLSLLFSGSVRRRAALALLGAAFGLLWTGGYHSLFRAPALALAAGEPAKGILTVTDYPSPTAYGASVPVRISLPGHPDPKAILYLEDDGGDLRPGDELSAVVLWTSTGSAGQGRNSAYQQSRGIYLTGSASEYSLSRRPADIPLPFLPQRAARSWKASIASHVPDDVAGFLSALITGDKRNLPDGLYAAFRRAGLAHVVAVSGLHVGFLTGLLTTLLGRRRFSSAAGMALVFFFAAAAGNSPSVLRAAFMEAFLLAAPLLNREADKPTTLSAVLLLLLLQCPYAAAGVGLQLSFGAVAGIYLITGPLYARWTGLLPKGRGGLRPLLRAAGRFFFGSLSTTLGALLFTTPLTAWYFRSISLAGPLTNLLTLWAVSGVFLAGLLIALAGPFLPALTSLLGMLSAWPARWILWAAREIARWPFAALTLTTIYLVGWFVLAYAVFLFPLFLKGRVRPVVPAGITAVTLCAALLMSLWPAFRARLTVTALDVGQGSSTLFFSQNHAVLVDCGGNSADDPGDLAADALQGLGLSRLDVLVLTHFHSDHADGVPELLARVDVSRLLLPDVEPEDPLRQKISALAEESGCEVEFLSDDFQFSFGGASMTLYAPLGDGGANEEGLSALCTAGDFDVLVTGDMNDVIERRLVKYKHLPDIELLVAGHHGSKNATSEELLLAARPEAAVISSGYNRYGHPAPETLERLGAAGCDIYRTDGMGNITFTIQ